MSDADLIRRRIIQAASGEWNPGFPVNYDSIMTYGNRTAAGCKCGTASLFTPVLPISTGENNVTYALYSLRPDGTQNTALLQNASFELFKDGTYNNYYDQQKINAENTRSTAAANLGINGLRFTVWLFGAEKSYAYIRENGRVLFAGKESPYYGKEYITD